MAKRVTTTQDESRRNKIEFLEMVRGDPRVNRLPVSVRMACDKVGISRTTVKNWRQTDSVFSSAYDDAMEDGVDVVEDEAVRRAVQGVTRAVYHAGEVVGHEQNYSDGLLQFILAGRRSAVYGRRPEVANQINLSLEAPSDRDVAKALTLLIEEAKQKQSVDAE